METFELGNLVLGLLVGGLLLAFIWRFIARPLHKRFLAKHEQYEGSMQAFMQQDIENEEIGITALQASLYRELNDKILTDQEFQTLQYIYAESFAKHRHLVHQKYQALQTFQRIDEKRQEMLCKIQDLYAEYRPDVDKT